MANNTRIGCSAGKTTLVDPNAFDGQSSTSNIFVPIEDLSIYVQLETHRKSRTILTSEGVKNTGKTSAPVRVTFIEGTDVAGKKVLTTKYTDLTTTFDEINNEEGLGITSIDIDFNSSYAPLITINFIDIRGTAIFQNEEKLQEGRNKYGTFFQLPYPLYTLTVKGYYGMPVSYCLHMTKFTSKFNSQTGNFEITASFVGYTYAMLSDLLLGYLKAIEYTKLGKEKYASLSPSVITLNTLVTKINNINKDVEKISAEDPDAAQFAKAGAKKEILDTIKTNIYMFGSSVDIKKDLEEYKFIVVDDSVKLDEQIKLYIENAKQNISEFNADSYKFAINESDFTNAVNQTNIVSGLTITNLKKITVTPSVEYNSIGKELSEDFSSNLLKHLNRNNYGITDDKVFGVYDLRKLYTILSTKLSEVSKDEEQLKIDLADKIRVKVAERLGFDPTVRNMINVFTTAAEVFLSIIHKVSAAAKINPDRTTELKKFQNSIDQSYDYKKIDNGGGNLTDNYYPWPDYREKTQESGLVEEYLGKEGVLDNPLNVNELEFIDDLLKAFIAANKSDEANQLNLESQETNWFSSNPLDTRLMGLDSFPYQRIEGNSYGEIVKLMMIRAMTYFFSNRKLKPEEIQAIANAEIDEVLKYCINEKAVQALGQTVKQTFLDASGTINAQSEKVIQGPLNDSYYYNYIFGNEAISEINAKSLKVLPINKPFEGNISPDSAELVKLAKNNNLFLTNYTRSELVSATNKGLDGGIYIKTFSIDEYKANVKPTPTPSESDEIDFSVLKKDKSEFPVDGTGVGYKILSGGYGVQEFFKMNYGSSELAKLPFRYMFYENSNSDSEVYNKSNGLGYKRSASKGKDDKPPTSPFDINGASIYRVAKNWREISDYIDDDETAGFDLWLTSSERLHSAYGKTRELANKFLNGSSDVCYPFVNFQVENIKAKDGNNLVPVSLFGSRFFYEQKTEHAKALLFLHTFPWTGLVDKNAIISISKGSIFDKPEIYNTFGNRAGFISAPRLWVAFIGGLLWRADYSPPIYDETTNKLIGGGSGTNDPIIFYSGTTAFIPTLTPSSTYPSKWKYLTSVGSTLTTLRHPDGPMVFSSSFADYKELDDVLLGLPQQAKDEFKKVFFDFVDASDKGIDSAWDVIKQNLSVFNGTGAQWVTAYNNVTSSINMFNDPVIDEKVINYTVMKTTYNGNNNFKNYKIFTPLYDEPDFKYNFICEIDDTSSANQMMLKLLDDEMIIANMSWKIWDPDYTLNSNVQEVRSGIFATSADIDLYVTTILNKLAGVKDGLSASDKDKQRKQEIFGTSDENVIKLQLYRTCKNIYDKWVGGSEDENNVIFQCGGRNSIDTNLAKKYGGTTPKLIDSFRFVNRSFKDIGDKLVINPLPLNDYMTSNPNSSFYDVVTSLLSANYFDFVPLPTYVNYDDPNVLESIFKPMPTIEAFDEGVIGPTFVCVYVGQSSKHLDTSESEYPNDGFDFRCNSDGNMLPNIPQDFKNNSADYENKVAVFAVNYGQQNQNIFKDVVLDQSEFTETAESLQITDEIANKGAENHLTLAGQNMYNVYSVRSYKAEVEMMGNAMVQPMMYFQLNNIPMFHGAYLIIRVKHNIKPNYMSTHFTGVRVREPESPLLKVSEIFMSLLDTLASSSVQANGNSNPIGEFSNKGSAAKNPVIGTKADYAPYVNYDVPESDSLKFQEHDKGVKAKGDSFAMPECGEFMVELAKKWRAYAVSTPGTDCLYVNNFGAYGGGTNKKHGGDGGLHAIGLACDLQPMAKSKGQQRCIVGNSNYDQDANMKFIQMAIDLSKSQDKIKIQNIILNDQTIINHFASEKGSQGRIVIAYDGHDNHIHIEFDKPPRVVNEVKNNIKENQPIVSSGVKGQVTKLTGKLPTESERLNSLGQV